jgi:AraC-like DNA-binding protein
MRSFVHERGHPVAWGVARPAVPGRVAGVTMAGFQDRGVHPVDLRVVPHPAVMLVLEFGAGAPVVDDASGGRHRGSLVAGPGGAARARASDFACLQVRLSPLSTRALLGVSAAELGSAVVDLESLWGPSVARVRAQLGECSSWAERFSLVDLLLARRSGRSFVDPEVAWAWSRIVRGRGSVRVDALAGEVGWSRQRLWSRFGAQVGLPPKRAARLVRFDHAVHRLVAGSDVARVAAEGGYADQSHLHRDVVAFTGVTPSTVAGEPWLAVDDIAWS